MKKATLALTALALITTTSPVEAYDGKLRCKTLNSLMGRMSTLDVVRFCQPALLACEVQDMVEKNQGAPLVKEIGTSLNTRWTEAMNACELSILNSDPDYYNENLSREDKPAK
ncbi:MAG: hypothetical protein H2057_07825 [Alphaproteobacteria bacterium]|nr:hypothetical protein [Alphaproteobacteria bacterium]